MKVIEIRKNGTKRVYTRNTAPSKTDPSWAKEADVNNIMEKYRKTGQVNYLAKNQGRFADVSEIPDLSQALNDVARSNAAFMALPSELRLRFGNSPNEMVKFIHNPDNYQECVSLGIFPKPKSTPQAPEDKNVSTTKTKSKNAKLPSNDDESNDDDK